MPKSDNNKYKNIEEAIKTTVFLVPVILAISIFIFQAAEYASSAQNYYIIIGYWESILNNLWFIGAIISTILSWLFLIIYYFTERTNRYWLFISGYIAVLPILLLDFLVFFPNVFGLHLVTYSNFLYKSTALIIFVAILLAIIIYWIYLTYKAIQAQPHKPLIDRQQKILEIHSLIGARDTMLLAGIALLTLGFSLAIAIISGQIHTNLIILSSFEVFALIIGGVIATVISVYNAKQLEKKINALVK